MKRITLAALMLSTGCYGYYPVNGTPSPSRELQLSLTDSGSFVLARRIGPGMDALSGRVAGDSANAFVLSVTGVRNRDGMETPWSGERIAIPRPLILKIEERRFSAGRTTLFSGLVVLALVSLHQALGGTGGSSGGSGLPSGGTAK